MRLFFASVLLLSLFLSCSPPSEPQTHPEIWAWGNFNGIRLDGHLVPFETSLRLVAQDGSFLDYTGKERQPRPQFRRDGTRQTVITRLDSLDMTMHVDEAGVGQARVMVSTSARSDMKVRGAFFDLILEEGTALNVISETEVAFQTATSTIRLIFDEPHTIEILPNAARIPLVTGSISAGQTSERSFVIEVDAEIDTEPVIVTLDPSMPGRAFAGLGGNFRIQNPRLDSIVIDYNLANMRVPIARLEMPWMFWHPDESSDPIEEARNGRLHPRVKTAMDYTARMAREGRVVMLAAWSGPTWAIVGPRSFGPRDDGFWGNRLNQSKKARIYESIAAYVKYLKDEYDVDVSYFSFNESDLGINIIQSDIEHAMLFRELGAVFAAKGLGTKLLLGDTADAREYALNFIEAAISDQAARPYMGPVSFHSWRGWSDELLNRWADAARRTGLPLIVGEGSIDAAGWRYPTFFEEPVYALLEIDLYTRMMAITQPWSILQWQLTSDYSVLMGAGIFGTDGDLRPTQRFWNLKQISDLPENVFHMPITDDHPLVSSAAVGNVQTNAFGIQLVNNGATRNVTLNGLPESVKEVRIITTNQTKRMDTIGPVRVRGGSVTFSLEAMSYVTVQTL